MRSKRKLQPQISGQLQSKLQSQQSQKVLPTKSPFQIQENIQIGQLSQVSFSATFYNLAIIRVTMQRNSQEINLREGTNRANKYQESEEIHACECGKKYLTYTALYLHVKLKHGLRLKISKNLHNRTTQRVNFKTVITYFLKELQTPIQNITKIQPNPQNDSRKKQAFSVQIKLISDYLLTLKRKRHVEGQSLSVVQSVISNLLDYFLCLRDLSQSQELEQEEMDITFYFNEFVVYFMPLLKQNGKVATFQLQTVVSILMIFYKWLKSSSLTTVELKIHEQYCTKTQN